MSMKKFVALSAGGTGGHVFPAEALAKGLSAQGYRIAFVTDRRGGSFTDKFPDCTELKVNAKGYAGKGIAAKIAALISLGAGVLQCAAFFIKNRPAAVVGFGGYAAFPASCAAILLRIPLILHEQNSVLGGANRVLAPFATLIATSFEKVAKIPVKIKTVYTGLPLRPAILALKDAPYPAFDKEFNLLIIGGSQGAKIFSDVIPQALKSLPDNVRAVLKITQQCRAADLDKVNGAYAQSGLKVETGAFFTDIPDRLAKAHLVLCRAGASSIAELAAAKRPAIIVPIYRSPDSHQLHNAEAVVALKGAWLLEEPDFTPENLKNLILELFNDKKRLITAGENIGGFGRTDAARRLVDAVVQTTEA